MKAFKQIRFDIAETDEMEEDMNFEEETIDFERMESLHNSAFLGHGLVRLSCFSHTLQLAVSKFSSDPWAKGLLDVAYKVVSNVNRSGKATEHLISRAGKKLVAHCTTRWSTAYLVVQRLLEVREGLEDVLRQHRLTLLQPDEWEGLELVEKLLLKFAHYTDLAGGEYYATVSQVIPFIVELKGSLQQILEGEANQATPVTRALLSEMDRRFAKFTNQDCDNHNPIYMVATMLDPRYVLVLDLEQTHYAKSHCLQMLKNDSAESGTDMSECEDHSPHEESENYLSEESGCEDHSSSDESGCTDHSPPSKCSSEHSPPSKRRRPQPASMSIVKQLVKQRIKDRKGSIPTITDQEQLSYSWTTT